MIHLTHLASVVEDTDLYEMAGKSVTSGGGRTLRTYGRLKPLRRLQPQLWVSPADPRHLFSSSSSSSSLLSSSSESHSQPSTRKRRAASKAQKAARKCPAQRRPTAKRRRRVPGSHSETPQKVVSELQGNGSDLENVPFSERNLTAATALSTPFRRFVTIRRKVPGFYPERIERSIDAAEKVCGPRPRSTRMLSKDTSNILELSGEILHSPLQKCPLLSSTPSIALLTKRRQSGPVLCGQLEESVIVSCEEPAKASQDMWKKTHVGSVYCESVMERESSTLTVSLQQSRPPRLACEQGRDTPISVSDSFRTEECRRSACSAYPHSPSYFSPVLFSSCQSQSVFIEEPSMQCHWPEPGSVLCVSSSSECKDGILDAKENDQWDCMTQAHNLLTTDSHVLADSPSTVSLRGVSENVQTLLHRNHLHPVVRLNAESVTKYFQRKNQVPLSSPPRYDENPSNPRQSASDNHDKSWQSETDKRTNPSQSEGVSIVFPGRNMFSGNMQPVVLLDSNAVNNYLLKKQVVRPLLSLEKVDFLRECRDSPSAHTLARTPDFLASRMKMKALSSAGPQNAAGTGRKEHAVPVPRYKEDMMQSCAALSSSPLLSSSIFTSSFLNSTAAMNLSLSPGRDADPQREHRRWLRLRAALSLHRKKKVELALTSKGHIGRHNLSGVSSPLAASQRSSLLLLTPRRSSCEDLTDAEKVFMECDQDQPISFRQCLSTSELLLCQKVGEGVYGEVFKTTRGGKQVALKVIPIEGSERVNGEDQKSFSEILPEIIISKELSLLNEGVKNLTTGFIRLYSAHCVQGTYPTELLKAWDTYAAAKGTENDRPDFFFLKQLFMVLEFEFGGIDLECMSSQLPSVSVSCTILHQVTAALAVAEEELRFEHRDLHWGNLLIEKCESHFLAYSLDGDTKTVPTSGFQVKIIDYTLSRLDKDGLTVFTDLSLDEELFLGEGDLQFSVYREMRQGNKNSWSSYHPFSNVLWLYYLADKLLSAVTYVRKPSSALQRRELRKIQDFRRNVRNCSSAKEALHKSRLFK
uniref:Serine/threonine-protein kinase haspin n=2 Tax=Leptobrachium leishanense TaxID=445787 RepID=A0A8C5PPX7_9ANUR